MQFLLQQEMHILSGVILLLFGFYAVSVLDTKYTINKLYLASSLLTVILISFEIVYNLCLILKVDTLVARSIDGILYILSPVLPYLFLQFICSYYTNKFKISRKYKKVLTLLFFTNLVAEVLHFKYNTLRVFPFLIALMFITYSVYVVFKNKKMLLGFEYAYLLVLTLITDILFFTQIISGQNRFIWSCCTFTIILMFIVIQQRELYRDSLTGVRNRLILKKCMKYFKGKAAAGLSVVMMDLDHFKNINDSYGHSEGDFALKAFARLLQKVFSDNGIIIRMGGDEFIIFINNLAGPKVNDLIAKMGAMVDQYNSKAGKPYCINFSCASGLYNNDISLDQFIHEVDKKMYQRKNKRKDTMVGLEAYNA